MKLNPDCIRNILLTVENETTFPKSFKYEKDISYPLLNDFSHEEIAYHIKQANLNGFFTKIRCYEGHDIILISDLTPKAHEFLANIRNDTNWNKVKSKAAKVGSFSLTAITEIAANVISELIKGNI